MSLSAAIIITYPQSTDSILGMQHPHKQFIKFYPNLALFRFAISPGLNIVSNCNFFNLNSFSASPFVLGYNKQEPEFSPIDDTKM